MCIPIEDPSDEMNCHGAKTGSTLDLVGDRVHGCDMSSSLFTSSGRIRSGFGAINGASFCVDEGDIIVGKSGGVLRRGTPLVSRIISRYDLVIHGPVIPSLNASASTIFLSLPLRTKYVSERVSIVSKEIERLS